MKPDYTKMLRELTDQIAEPSPSEIVVPDERVAAVARRMAQNGYIPSETSLEAVRKYLQGYALWLSGGVGTGKTAFFRRLNGDIRVFPMLLTVGMEVDEIREWFNENRGNEVVLDDVGAEPVFNYYGNRFEILPWIVEMRMSCRARTHVTSNLSAKGVLDRYGARTVDRFSELCVKLDFKGQSRRAPKPVARRNPQQR